MRITLYSPFGEFGGQKYQSRNLNLVAGGQVCGRRPGGPAQGSLDLPIAVGSSAGEQHPPRREATSMRVTHGVCGLENADVI